MLDKVIVPLDGSPLSEAVLPWVRQLVAKVGSRVYLVRVNPDPTPAGMVYEGMVAVPIPPLNPSDLAEDARDYLERVAEAVGPGADTHVLVRWGAPAAEIVTAAQECGADLIAMSTHGRTGLGRLVLGSVADEVVRVSGMPVVLIHPDAAALQAAAATLGGGAVQTP